MKKRVLCAAILTLLFSLCMLPMMAQADDDLIDIALQIRFADADGREIREEEAMWGSLDDALISNDAHTEISLSAGGHVIEIKDVPLGYEWPEPVYIDVKADGTVESSSSFASAKKDKHGTWIITVTLEKNAYVVVFMNGDELWRRAPCLYDWFLPIAGMPVPEAEEGYVFDGWYTKDGIHVLHGMKLDRDMIAYATWREIAAPNLPKTGDPSSLLGWAMLLGASGIGVKTLKRRKK